MKDLTSGNVYKTFILFAIPIVLSGLLSMTYDLVDTMIAGKFLGEAGLAAVGASSGFVSFTSAIFWGYTNGYSVYIAHLFGAHEYRRLKNAVCNLFAQTAAVAVLLSALIILLRYPILRLLNTDPTVLEEAANYLATSVCGKLFAVFSYNAMCTLHALGISSFPFWVSLSSGLLKVAGNVLSVAILGWGVIGIALVTVLATLIGSLCYAFKLRRCFQELGVWDQPVTWGFADTVATAPYTLPSMVQQMSMYAATMLISPLVNVLGTAATAGYSVASKLFTLNAGIYQNSSKTLSNYIAQSLGAGKPENLKRGVRVGLLQGITLLTPMLLLCVFFAKPVCLLFFQEANSVALDYAVTFAQVFLPFLYCNVLNNLFHAFCRGIANMNLLLFCTVFGAVVRIAATALLTGTYGINGVYMGWVISWILEAVLNLFFYFSGMWKKAIRSLIKEDV